MKNNKIIQGLILTVTLILVSGCPPKATNTSNPDNQVTQSADMNAINQQLSKTTTGRQSLAEINYLISKGYTVQTYLMSQSEIQNLNGHSAGGFKINDQSISLYINNTLSIEEQAHVVAHELVHINDDLEIDTFLIRYPHVKSAAEDLVARYNSVGLHSFDQRVISYVLGTLFCTESRAYTRNQQLMNEGLATTQFAKGASLPQYIDQSYILKFGTQYGPNATTMNNWCLSQNSMTNIQNGLVW